MRTVNKLVERAESNDKKEELSDFNKKLNYAPKEKTDIEQVCKLKGTLLGILFIIYALSFSKIPSQEK